MRMNPKPKMHLSAGFALISVLALVSLAALTATAFLASARLERQATVSLSQSTTLEMALSAGANVARELVDWAPSRQFNFVTTYWRGTGPNDWTNELGYLLNGAATYTNSSLRDPIINGQSLSLVYTYHACFSTATMTNLGTRANDQLVVSNSVIHQGTFTSQMATFMQTMTNFPTNPVTKQPECTNIPLLGNTNTNPQASLTDTNNRLVSPPVGWVYITQDKRDAKTGKTNTVPVARFAFFVQDQASLLDAERMGGFTNGLSLRASTNLPATYTPGTNPAEISLGNLTGTALTNSAKATAFAASSNRVRYLTPGMLVLPTAGGLSTNDLRYVTTGLRHWTNAWERVPAGLGYGNVNRTNGTNGHKLCTTNFTNASFTLSNLVSHISSNCPAFTNRAGGMNGNGYLYALAANMVDYIDNNSSPTSTNINLGTTANPTNFYAIGFDNYPLPTILHDKLNLNGSNLTITSYWQFWNCSSLTSPPASYQITNNVADTLFAYGTNNPATKTETVNLVAGNPRLVAGSLTSNITIPQLLPGASCVISVSSTNLNLVSQGWIPANAVANLTRIWINHTNTGLALDNTNSFSISLSNGLLVTRANTGYERKAKAISNSATVSDWSGCMPALRYIQKPGWGTYNQPPSSGDPRMLIYLTNSAGWCLAACDFASATEWGLGWAQWTGNGNPYYGDPGMWPDGSNATGLPQAGTKYPVTTNPPLGTNAARTSVFAKLSTNPAYTNICELGNIFDPIQWSSATISTQTNWINYDIKPGTLWTPNSMYGGGSTLRIGRPEHSLFAFTNLAGATVATPNMQMSAAALLDLFCTARQYDESGQINLNTAPAPVLRALAGRVFLRNDATPPNLQVPDSMAEAFAQGVMRFRHRYPFYSPSQLCFIGTDPTWPNTNSWPANAVFGNRSSILLRADAPGNSAGGTASMGASAWNDQAAEEWFAKVYKLSTTQSRNFRVYVVAQLVDTNKAGVGPVVRKYYNVCTRQNADAQAEADGPSASTFELFSAPY